MKKAYIAELCLLGIIGVYFIFLPVISVQQKTNLPPSVDSPPMQLTSLAFENNTMIPKEYTCDGKKVHPPLTIRDAPDGAQSLVIIVDDPDAPTGTFNHWVIWNIDPSTTNIAAGEVPQFAQQGISSSGREGFVAPCPPTGQHRYFFTVYALDTKLTYDGQAKKNIIQTAMIGHTVAQAQLVGIYYH